MILKLKIITKVFAAIITTTLLIFLTSCDSGTVDTADDNNSFDRGSIIESESNGNFTTDIMQSMLTLYDMAIPINPYYAVDAYKITYTTVDNDGNYVTASGALFIPVGGSGMPLISTHHGTQPERAAVGSVNPLYAFDGMIAASLGYVACSPDYLGMGVSEMIHPYHVAESSADAVIDFIRAAKQFCAENNINLNGQLFLAGYSEGGYVTMAAHKKIEEEYPDEFAVTASAPMAGAYDLIGTADVVIGQQSYCTPTFLSFLLLAYNDVYEWNRLSDIFQSPYDTAIPTLFDGTNGTVYIESQLPSDLTNLFTESFLTNYSNGSDTQLISALQSNCVYDWTPNAPIKIYHGNADDTVPYQNAVTAYNTLIANGASNIELVTIDGGNHATSVVPSIIGMVGWFETFRTNTHAQKNIEESTNMQSCDFSKNDVRLFGEKINHN